MTVIDWLEVFSLLVLLAISTPLLGNYMVRVYSNGPAPGDRVFLPMENFVYRICRIDPKSEQRWRSHLVSMLVWTLVGGLLTYFVLTGAKVVVCDHCGHSIDVGGGESPCRACGGMITFRVGEARINCPYCKAEVGRMSRTWRGPRLRPRPAPSAPNGNSGQKRP